VGHRVRALGIMLAILAGPHRSRADPRGHRWLRRLSLPTNEAGDLYSAGYTLGGTIRTTPRNGRWGCSSTGST